MVENDPSFTDAEDELNKIEALKDVIWLLADGFDSQRDSAPINALQYISNRLDDHCRALRKILYGESVATPSEAQ